MNGARVIEFSLDGRSGVSPYLQVVQQVRNALRLGLLREGDQLPTVKDVVSALAINPNTVLKAYRELEHEGLAEDRLEVVLHRGSDPADETRTVRLRPVGRRWADVPLP